MPAEVDMPMTMDKLLLEHKMGNLDAVYFRKGGRKPHVQELFFHRFGKRFYNCSYIDWNRLLEAIRVIVPLAEVQAIAVFGEAVSLPYYWHAKVITGKWRKKEHMLKLMHARPDHVDIFIWTEGCFPRKTEQEDLKLLEIDREEKTSYSTIWRQNGLRIFGCNTSQAFSHWQHGHPTLTAISTAGVLLAIDPYSWKKHDIPMDTLAVAKAARNPKIEIWMECSDTAATDATDATDAIGTPFTMSLDDLYKGKYIY